MGEKKKQKSNRAFSTFLSSPFALVFFPGFMLIPVASGVARR
jgi:hypothetical protein